MNPHRISRRRLLKGLGAAAMFTRFGWMNTLAQANPPGYKALVCIFLAGGNDGHNTIVPLSQAEFNAYKAARGSLALPDGNGWAAANATPGVDFTAASSFGTAACAWAVAASTAINPGALEPGPNAAALMS